MKRFKDKFYRTVRIGNLTATLDESCNMGKLRLGNKPLEGAPKVIDCHKDGFIFDVWDDKLVGIEFFGVEHMPQFVVDALYGPSAEVRECIWANEKEWEQLEELINNPPPPNENLKRLMRNVVVDQDQGDE